MTNQIYVINGLPGSGKTTFGVLVGEHLKREGINFLHTSSIGPVKEILRPRELWTPRLTNHALVSGLEAIKRKVARSDWDGLTKDEYWRRKMSETKVMIGEYNPKLIHGLVLDEVDELEKPRVAFVDIREPAEIVSFQEHIRETRWDLKVERLLVTSDRSITANNFSDKNVNGIDYDIIIENNRGVCVGDREALWLFNCRAGAFVEQEILGGRVKERLY